VIELCGVYFVPLQSEDNRRVYFYFVNSSFEKWALQTGLLYVELILKIHELEILISIVSGRKREL
jgi:hypothetical protein